MVWYIYVISFYFSSFYLSTCYQQVNLKNFLYICCVPKVLSKFFKFCMSELQHIPVLQPLESPLSFTAPGNSSIRTQRVLLFTYTAQYLDKDQKNPTTGFLSSLSSALFSLVPCHTKCTHFSILNSSLFFPPSDEVVTPHLGFTSLCCNLENTQQETGSVLFSSFMDRNPALLSDVWKQIK